MLVVRGTKKLRDRLKALNANRLAEAGNFDLIFPDTIVVLPPTTEP